MDLRIGHILSLKVEFRTRTAKKKVMTLYIKFHSENVTAHPLVTLRNNNH